MGSENKKPSVGGVWIFSGTTQWWKLTGEFYEQAL